MISDAREPIGIARGARYFPELECLRGVAAAVRRAVDGPPARRNDGGGPARARSDMHRTAAAAA